MPAPGEHKTVQARILAYAQEIGWRFVSRAEAEARRGFTPHLNPHPDPLPEGEGMKSGEREHADEVSRASLYFGDVLHRLVTTHLRVQDIDLVSLGSRAIER